MVNIFSFFTGGRKKSKRSSWAGAGLGQPEVSSSSAVNPSTAPDTVKCQTSRFLSLRTRSSGRMIDAPKDLPDPRRSAESLSRKATNRKSKSIGALPRLDLDLGPVISSDGPQYSGGQENGLGLDDFGQPPRFTKDEVEVIRSVQLNVDEIKNCWEVFGKSLKSTGCDTVGLMLPQHHDPDPTTVHHLLALFLLHHQPALAPSFPSIQSRPAHQKPAPLYSDMLESALKDRPHPHELCEVLIFALQHLTPSQSPLVDTAMYTKFVQAEHSASYPLDAYTTMLRPRLPQGVGAFLDVVFDVLSEIASKSEENMVTGGKLCLVLGRWIWGARSNEGMEWDEVYQDWQVTGRRVEHLFYAWIRSQSTKVTQPTRLLELVEAYPFGDSTLSSEHLPSPPPSTFPRHTIHITLEAGNALADNILPSDVLRAALTADPLRSTPALAALQGHATSQDELDTDHILAYDSQAFLKRFTPAVPTTVNTPSQSSFRSPVRSTSSLVPGDQRKAGERSDNALAPPRAAQLDNGSPALTPLAELSEQLAGLANGHQGSSTREQPASWDDFRQSGFSNAFAASDKLDLAISPKDVPLPLSPLSEIPSRPEVVVTPQFTLRPLDERIIEIDDAFLPFIEDTQLAAVDPMLSRLCLVRLSADVSAKLDTPTPVEWLLLTVSVRSPVPVDNHTLVPRGPSPSRESVMSRKRFSLGGLTSTFRRSISGSVKATSATTRRSVFGGTNKDLAGELDPLFEASPTPGQAKSPALTTLGEFGEVRAPHSKSAPAPPEVGPNGTPVSDWHYIAEGGANVVFGYHGTDSRFKGKALRIPKDASDTELDKLWRDELLPRLLPPQYLPTSEKIDLKTHWVDELLDAAADYRPDWRKEAGHTAADGGDSLPAVLMEDLRSGIHQDGQKVFAIEIKPKWGFTPSAGFVTPPEAAAIKSQISRYRLHQHFRGKETEYEPLDLYSGDSDRMSLAIRGLWKDWRESGGQINNWRVFVDGLLVKPEQEPDVPGLLSGDVVDRTLPFLLPVLQGTAVLEKLQRLQSHLDATDISYIAERITAEQPDLPLFDTSIVNEISKEELKSFVDLCLVNPDAGQDWTLRQSIIAYSLSAIFKDCSIFLTCPLTPAEDGSGSWKLLQSAATVKVIDLDLKPVQNMRKWYDLDEKIWRHWLSTHPSDVNNDSSATPPPGSPGLATGTFETPKPLREIPDRLYNASTDALFVPTPDRPLTNPLDSPSLHPPGTRLASGVDTSSTRALFARTPGGSGAGTPVEELEQKETLQFPPAHVRDQPPTSDVVDPTPPGALASSAIAEEDVVPVGTSAYSELAQEPLGIQSITSHQSNAPEGEIANDVEESSADPTEPAIVMLSHTASAAEPTHEGPKTESAAPGLSAGSSERPTSSALETPKSRGTGVDASLASISTEPGASTFDRSAAPSPDTVMNVAAKQETVAPVANGPGLAETDMLTRADNEQSPLANTTGHQHATFEGAGHEVVDVPQMGTAHDRNTADSITPTAPLAPHNLAQDAGVEPQGLTVNSGSVDPAQESSESHSTPHEDSTSNADHSVVSSIPDKLPADSASPTPPFGTPMPMSDDLAAAPLGIITPQTKTNDTNDTPR